MNITLANLESFQEAVKQASRVLKCSSLSERLKLADNMRKGATCDFFQLDLEDDDDDEEEGNEEDGEEGHEESNSVIADENSK